MFSGGGALSPVRGRQLREHGHHTEHLVLCGLRPVAELQNICSDLFNTINERSINSSEKSYTNYLLTKGSNTILKKIGEESAEFIMACKDNDKNSISNEAADLIYHLQVALKYKGVEWRDVLAVLESRRKIK